ncbi:HD-GYP domain-containing protein [Bacillus sp. FJAT-45037]|uniref:HD-GYP domain-containing protein n=1 Tax=Bacillus sp. FJAT-45037 TaxID=2011007 RepID=UPI000C241920|nr:HD domain-containing phosphohydrolase [Bacillus sp. FJAT-45037]
MDTYDQGMKVRGDLILGGLACLMSLGVLSSIILFTMHRTEYAWTMLIGFTFAGLFHWVFFILHRQFNKEKTYYQHLTAGTVFLLFFLVTVYNPLSYSEMWVYLLFYPIILGLLESKKVYITWSTIFLAFYFIFLFLDPTQVGWVIENALSILSRLLFGVGSVVVGYLMVMNSSVVKTITIHDTETRSKEHVVYLLNTLVPIVETKTQTSRSEIEQASELMKKIVAHFPEERIHDWEIELLSLAHYVSRVQWPDYLFEKGDKLTSYEFKVVQDHCLLGVKLLGNFPAFSKIKEAFINHHERIDGSGYPFNLKEKDISTLSQILGIVETFLAMTKPRAYREEHSIEAVLKEIKEMSGRTYKKKVVEALVKVLETKSSVESERNVS